MPTDRNKDSSFTLLSNVTLVYQWEDLSQTHWPVLKVVWNCVREGGEKCWSMTWVSRRQLSPLWRLGSSCSSLEETRWAVLSVVIDVPKNKGTRNIHPKQEFIRRRHVHKGGAFQGNVLPKLTLQSQADLTVPLSAEQVKPCSRHRDCSYSVDIKPECKNFTCAVVSLQEITSQTLDNTAAQTSSHRPPSLPSPPPKTCIPMQSSPHFTRWMQLQPLCKES